MTTKKDSFNDEDNEIELGNIALNLPELEEQSRRKFHEKRQGTYFSHHKERVHRFVLQHQGWDKFCMYAAGNCETGDDVVKRFSLDHFSIVAEGEICPRGENLEDLTLQGTRDLGYGGFILHSIGQKCAYAVSNAPEIQPTNIRKVSWRSIPFLYVNDFWVRNKLLPIDVKKRRYTVERAVKVIDEVLDRAETEYKSTYGHDPCLFQDDDFFKFAKILKIREIVERHRVLKPEWNDTKIDPLIDYQDIAHRVMHRQIGREPYLQNSPETRQNALDAMLGRLEYNPPSREYELRIGALQSLEKEWVDFAAMRDFFLDKINALNRFKGFDISGELGHQIVNPAYAVHKTWAGASCFQGGINKLQELAKMRLDDKWATPWYR